MTDKNKAPSFPFYVKDWLGDPQLKMASYETKGIWADLLCFMWMAPDKGELRGTLAELSRLTGATELELERFIVSGQRLLFCDIYVTGSKESREYHICNRRMVKEEKKRKADRLRQRAKRDREKSHNNPETSRPLSSSSSSFAKKKENSKRNPEPKQTPPKNPNDKAKRAKAFPPDFELDAIALKVAVKHGISELDAPSVWDMFKHHHVSKGSKMVDWRAAWVTWVLRDKTFNKHRDPSDDDPSGGYEDFVKRNSGGRR